MNAFLELLEAFNDELKNLGEKPISAGEAKDFFQDSMSEDHVRQIAREVHSDLETERAENRWYERHCSDWDNR